MAVQLTGGGKSRFVSRTAERAFVQKTGEIQVSMLMPLTRYVRSYYGQAAVDSVLEKSGLNEMIAARCSAASFETYEKFMDCVGSVLQSETEFLRAAVHDFDEIFSRLIPVLKDDSVSKMLHKYISIYPKFSSLGKYEISMSGLNSMMVRYRSKFAETKTMCFARQAQLSMIPVLCGADHAVSINEKACMAKGSGHCLYILKWR